MLGNVALPRSSGGMSRTGVTPGIGVLCLYHRGWGN